MRRKKTGQHFLCDSKVAEREIHYAEINRNDSVLEIGSGTGVLTRLLAEKAQLVIAIEIDPALVSKLKSTLPFNVKVIQGDATKTDFNTLPRFNKIVANLPFQISSPITFKMLHHDFSVAVLIYQKEFAQRMVAEKGSKNYSRLSVNVYYRAHCELLEIVPKTCFYPQPRVDSYMVRLRPRWCPPFYVKNEEFFYTFTRELFNYRRKKIRKILKDRFHIASEKLPYRDRRVEDLAPHQIGELSDKVHDLIPLSSFNI
jgi:16S rRNA (adenine1518-N6/adenine1519-N6)-dimethyltransferase